MNLIFNHVMKFQNIHITNSNFLTKRFPCSSIIEFHFTVFFEPRFYKLLFYLFVSSTGKWWYYGLIIQSVSGETKVHFQYLSQVHTRRYTKWCQDNINWSPILPIRHI